ncbi:MAG: hypothetical protein NWF14_00375 [Candidatus Bathyarchaeota archaeon]|nr:hypothetical protein [Candidatus Bathyarchaeota archaeon]
MKKLTRLSPPALSEYLKGFVYNGQVKHDPDSRKYSIAAAEEDTQLDFKPLIPKLVDKTMTPEEYGDFLRHLKGLATYWGYHLYEKVEDEDLRRKSFKTFLLVTYTALHLQLEDMMFRAMTDSFTKMKSRRGEIPEAAKGERQYVGVYDNDIINERAAYIKKYVEDWILPYLNAMSIGIEVNLDLYNIFEERYNSRKELFSDFFKNLVD